MHIVLDAHTALEYWLSDLSPSRPLYVSQGSLLTSFEHHSCTELSQAIDRAGGERGAIELLVGAKEERRRSDNVICNAWGARPLPPRSLCEIGYGIYAVSPELCVLRMAPFVSRVELLRIISDLLGIFCRQWRNRIDLTKRSPILTVEDLTRYADSARGVAGVAFVRNVLSWVREGSASPRETSMDLLLAMPTRMGGMGLSRFDANHEITLTAAAKLLTKKKYLVGDAVFYREEKSGIPVYEGPVLEYNSNKYHDTEERQVMDFEKITALQRMGFTVIPVSVDQFNSYNAFAEIAQQVRELTGVRNAGKPDVLAARDVRRSSMHEEMLRLERQQRERRSLADTARWSYLKPLLHNWKTYEG